MANKIRVAVIYGGKSGEHEVSMRSAASVIRHLDRNRYEVLPIGISKEGRWFLNDPEAIFMLDQKSAAVENSQSKALALPQMIVPGEAYSRTRELFDVVFPVTHGPLYEDGALQGLLRLAEIPMVGPDVLGAALSMDKVVSKQLAAASGLPVVPYSFGEYQSWLSGSWNIDAIMEKLVFPVFVKPANLGSSVGTYKVKNREALKQSIDKAFLYDNKLIVEQGLSVREIELSVMQNIADPMNPAVSMPGEIIVSSAHEFYSYEAKYIDAQGADLGIPAALTSAQCETAQSIAKSAFCVLQSKSMARVDLFLEKETGQFYFNELNSLPGFTEISMYPKLWEASGMPYPQLLTKLIDLALAQFELDQRLIRNFTL